VKRAFGGGWMDTTQTRWRLNNDTHVRILASSESRYDRQAESMTNQEWEKAIMELRDAQLVTQRIIERQARDWSDRFELLVGRLEVLTSVVEKHEERFDQIVDLFEKFIQGRQSNGHKN
jgi:hypothetical protein